MAMKNKYAKRARISEAKIREIVRYVAADLTALQAAALSGLNRNTVNRLYRGRAGAHAAGLRSPAPAVWGRRGRRELLRGAAPTARPSSSASSSGRATSRPRSSRTAQRPPSRASSAVGSTRAPSSTSMAGAATTAWSTSAMATSASTRPATSAPKAPSISPASKASGA